jgi:hypothetical protein
MKTLIALLVCLVGCASPGYSRYPGSMPDGCVSDSPGYCSVTHTLGDYTVVDEYIFSTSFPSGWALHSRETAFTPVAYCEAAVRQHENTCYDYYVESGVRSVNVWQRKNDADTWHFVRTRSFPNPDNTLSNTIE